MLLLLILIVYGADGGVDCGVTVGFLLVSYHITMADGGSDDEVIHLASFNIHRSQGKTLLYFIIHMDGWMDII